MAVVQLPDAIDQAAIDATLEVLDRDHDADHTLALVSGGHDSLTALFVALLATTINVDGVVHVNTGIGIPETRAFVQQRCRDLGLEYYEVGSEYRLLTESYRYQVEHHGFPGPPLHDVHYRNLKEHPLQRFLADLDGSIRLISGVRRHESENRMENVDEAGIGTYLGYPTVSPLVEWRGIDVTRFRAALDLPSNPVVEKLEMSGECLCGSFASHGERRMIKLFYPEVHRYLLCLEASVTPSIWTRDVDPEYAEWGHGQYSDRELTAKCDDDQQLLCATCNQRQECDR